MKHQEITTLKLIQSLDKEPEQTQRDLASELNVSLGLVNAFIKRLLNKGYFKIKTFPRNRIKYILTPEGMCEKTRLTYQYLLYSLEFYRETRATIRAVCTQIAKYNNSRVFLIGATELAEIAIISLQESDLQLAGVYDDDRVGDIFLGIEVLGLSSLHSASANDIALITALDTNKALYDTLLTYFHADAIVDISKK